MEASNIISIVGLAVKLLEIFVPLVNKKNEEKPKKNDKNRNKKLKKQKNQTYNNNKFKDNGDICIQNNDNKPILNVKNTLPKNSLKNLKAKKLSENLDMINKNLREHVYQKYFVEYSKEERLLKKKKKQSFVYFLASSKQRKLKKKIKKLVDKSERERKIKEFPIDEEAQFKVKFDIDPEKVPDVLITSEKEKHGDLEKFVPNRVENQMREIEKQQGKKKIKPLFNDVKEINKMDKEQEKEYKEKLEK
ncbi:hypothetical protein C1645_840160 [Glomus cerebriforme]|uniref:Uncharacterized protein n=1 Tax=Glomus cerebriforme TaxID=658196 RepID=A0A397SBF8_9GLOM|nr:hypothetical protein C1645_840160 [Glomus cerebriforme]